MEIHLGEVILRKNSPEDIARGAKPLEVEGLSKSTAGRLMSLAQPRQTLMTAGAFDLVRRASVGNEMARRNLKWLAHGDYFFKGVKSPVEIFEVGETGFGALAAPPDSEKAHRAEHNRHVLGWLCAVVSVFSLISGS